jgi:hypothetical protein
MESRHGVNISVYAIRLDFGIRSGVITIRYECFTRYQDLTIA